MAGEIKQNFSGDVLADEATLKLYSHDASLFEVSPRLVVFPKVSKDIQNLVHSVTRLNSQGEHLSLTARAGGTDMSGGPLSESVVVEFDRYLNHLKEIGEDFAVTEPGVYYRDFEKETLKHNLLLPSFPASREICTVGGMVANNSGGEKTLTYGKTEDYLEEVKMILSDGEEHSFQKLNLGELEAVKNKNGFEGQIYRRLFDLINNNYDLLQSAKPKVSKNSAGYYLWNVYDKEKGTFDLTKLLVGSQGTLGIITEFKVRLVTPKPHSQLLVIFLKDLKLLAKVVNHVLKFRPESFESYDDHTLKVAVKLFPELAAKLKGNILSLGLEFLPEFFMLLSGGVPKLVLLAEFTGDSIEEAKAKAREAQLSLKEFNLPTRLVVSKREAQKYWVIRRESFNLLRKHVRGMRTAPFIDDIIVRPEELPEFLPELYGILNQYPILYTIAGHAGDGNFHIIPLMNMSDPKSLRIIKELGPRVYRLIFKYHGSITAEHNDGLIRSPYLKEFYGDRVYELFEETKRIFDPQNIFNPGKKVGSDLDYALNHIRVS